MVDREQNLMNATGYQVANQTVVSFSRALCTGDQQDSTIPPDAIVRTAPPTTLLLSRSV